MREAKEQGKKGQLQLGTARHSTAQHDHQQDSRCRVLSHSPPQQVWSCWIMQHGTAQRGQQQQQQPQLQPRAHQAWNCWLMQQRKRKEEDQTSHHTGAPRAAVPSRPAAKKEAGRKSCGGGGGGVHEGAEGVSRMGGQAGSSSGGSRNRKLDWRAPTRLASTSVPAALAAAYQCNRQLPAGRHSPGTGCCRSRAR